MYTFSRAKDVWKNLPLNADGCCGPVKCVDVLLCFCMEFLGSLKGLFPLLHVNSLIRKCLAGYKLTV